MRPSHLELPGLERRDRRQTWSQDRVGGQAVSQTQSQQNTRRSRFEGSAYPCFTIDMHSQSADSWIDLSSQPSSSSLASQNDRDEIITAGLQIRQESGRRSRHLLLSNANTAGQTQRRSTSVAGSSQDEYEESESESDRVLSSSNEDVSNVSEPLNDDEDDTQTALGMPTRDHHIFTPQPNAFTHPPQSRAGHGPSNSMPVDSYFPPQHTRQQPPPSSSHRIPSNRMPNIQRPTQPRSTSNISPDHDAALRASLTTLLSCANAVRKDREPAPQLTRNTGQPTALRLVPESELNARDQHAATSRSPKLAPKRRSRESSKDRQAKKLRPIATKALPSEEVLVTPTMMTWFISAGVVLVFSAISFSAGYAWGKEVGRYEAQIGIEGASCGREVMRSSRSGLGKIRLAAAGA